MTGSVGIIDGKKLANQPQPNIDALLQGQIAEYRFLRQAANRGKEQKIRNSRYKYTNGDADPLWVIDGVPMQNSVPEISSSEIKTGNFDNMFITGIAGINPNDIRKYHGSERRGSSSNLRLKSCRRSYVVTTKKVRRQDENQLFGKLIGRHATTKDNNLMNSKEKLTYEQTLWDEFSATDFAAGKTNYP